MIGLDTNVLVRYIMEDYPNQARAEADTFDIGASKVAGMTLIQ